MGKFPLKPEKLIHLPPEQLDQNIRETLNRLGERREFWAVDPVGIDFTKTKDRDQTQEWDDNEQHTEQGI